MLICPGIKDNILTQMQEVNPMDSMHKQKPVRSGGTSSCNHTLPIENGRQMYNAGLYPIQTSEVWPSRTVTSELGISLGKDIELGVISIGSTPISHIYRQLKLYNWEANIWPKFNVFINRNEIEGKLPPQVPFSSGSIFSISL